MQIHVAKSELWSMPVDAVVNPANSLGIMGGGIGGALRRNGGDVIRGVNRPREVLAFVDTLCDERCVGHSNPFDLALQLHDHRRIRSRTGKQGKLDAR